MTKRNPIPVPPPSESCCGGTGLISKICKSCNGDLVKGCSKCTYGQVKIACPTHGRK